MGRKLFGNTCSASCSLESPNSNDMQETLYRILKGACPRDSHMRAGWANSPGWLLTRVSMLTFICHAKQNGERRRRQNRKLFASESCRFGFETCWSNNSMHVWSLVDFLVIHVPANVGSDKRLELLQSPRIPQSREERGWAQIGVA